MRKAYVKVAALKAAAAGSRFLLASCLMIAAAGLLLRVFPSKGGVDYRTSLIVGAILSTAWFLLIFSSTLGDHLANEHLGGDIVHVFPATMFVQMIVTISVILMGFVFWGSIHEGDSPLGLAIPLGFWCLAFYSWPRTIHLAEAAIWQRNRWGRRIVIPYNAVESIALDARDDAVIVQGMDGNKIVHCMYHRNRKLFVEEIERLTGKQRWQ